MPSTGPDKRRVEIGLGLGSNIGDKPRNIIRALTLLEARGAIAVSSVSSIYRTAPWGYLNQEDFANACALATTTHDPGQLLAEVKAVETEMGRQTGVRWGPRLIDIDILFFGGETWVTADLVLPHKDLFNRAFVLVPLAEIAPRLRLDGREIGAAAAAVSGGVEKWSKS
jgi:2-amino-4-hydroxy-6-hydroxymethyldihydropteridine diphosphokinase